MKATLLGIILFLCTISLFAQNNYSIKGAVADTTTKVKLVNTLITVLNSKDSTLVKFGRVTTDGSFSINSLSKGNYILLVTYPAYADYVAKFALDSVNTVKNFGQINLTLKARLLEEIVINGTAAISIKGDTTVFSTSNLKLQPNSNVEDLLKQLPGIQVDQNGKITAQGQTVEKVLVDGEEFFGDDPTLVTKNIRGDMVKNVQLFDKKSDQATFTGIDDGVKTKTLNIQLKDGSKTGYFGKADAGKTPDNYYQGQGMFNQFKAKKKFAAYGTVGNTGKTGLGFEDAGKYGGGNSNVQAIDGGLMILGNGGDELESFNGRYDGRGIPLARSGGAHFDSKWNKDKESINTNYKIGSLSVDGNQNTLTQNTLPSGVINTDDGQDYRKQIFRQKLDATYEVKFNARTTLKITADGTLKNTENNSHNSAFKTRGDNTDLNESDRTLTNDGDQKIMNASAFWTQKLKKEGRTFSLNITEAFNKSNTKGFLNSTNTFYDITGANIDSIQHIDQYKTNISKSSVLASNMTWSEPFSKTFSLILNYGVTLRNETAERRSFNQSATGYDNLDQQFSNNFKLDQTSNLAGAVFNYTKKKTLVNFGTRVSAVSYNQTDLDNNIEYKRSFLNWSPQARYQYRFSQQGALNINYNGNTTQPRIDQIQPIRVNDDPLNITLGNADLKPSFRSNFNLNYYSYKVLTAQDMGVGASYGITSNPIVSNRSTDEAGKTTLQTVNITDKTPFNYSLYTYFGRQLKKSELRLMVDAGLNGGNSYNYITFKNVTALNESQNASYNISLSASINKLKKYNFRFSAGPRYNVNKSSLQPLLNYNNWAISSNAYFAIFLPGKVEITSDARYTYTEKTATFSQSINPFIWNSSISKKFFKKENLKFSISGSDLLNQNVGFNRNGYTQNSYTTIQRYFMGSLTWDFTKMGGAAAAQK